MGVQDVVARLNKSKPADTATIKTIPSMPTNRKNTAPIVNKMFPPSPAVSPTSTINSSSSSSTKNSNSIASMLQKFGQPPSTSTPKKPITTASTTKLSTTTAPITKPSTTTAPITKKSTTTIPTTTTTTEKSTITKEESKLPTPPESPVITIKEKPSNVTQPSLNSLLLGFDSTSNEIVDLLQSLIDQNTAAEEKIESLKKDVEKYASDATKVRDYEIRVEYLALKLEQVSEERDYFEKELNELATNTNNNKKSSIVSPLSPAISQIDEKQQDIIIEEEQKLQNQNNDAYMADILGVYEEISDDGEEGSDELQIFDEHSQSQQQQQQEEIEILNDKLIECDRGVQIALMKYVQDLETQRLETKALKEVVQKQDELITKLETKLQSTPENSDELLKEQVEVQRVELENKRELLAQLLNEREDLLRRLNSSNPRNSSLRRSSIELISNMTQRPTSYSSIASSSGGQGRGSPPLTAPPKQPLPPLPPKHLS